MEDLGSATVAQEVRTETDGKLRRLQHRSCGRHDPAPFRAQCTVWDGDLEQLIRRVSFK